MALPLEDDLFPDVEPLHPVPEEQLPIREYEQLRDSGFFCWGALEVSTYSRRLSWVAFWFALLASPVIASCFPPQQELGHFILTVVATGMFAIFLALIRLYVGWSHVGRRLSQESFVYEESGWYDGELWEKSEEELNKDRLVFEYQVQPILKRVFRTMVVLGAIAAIEAVLWPWL